MHKPIDAGRCIPTGTITNAQMPDLDAEIDHLPEGGFGWDWWVFCAAKCTQNGADRSIPCSSIFQKNNTAPKNPNFALKFAASLREYYSYKP